MVTSFWPPASIKANAFPAACRPAALCAPPQSKGSAGWGGAGRRSWGVGAVTSLQERRPWGSALAGGMAAVWRGAARRAARLRGGPRPEAGSHKLTRPAPRTALSDDVNVTMRVPERPRGKGVPGRAGGAGWVGRRGDGSHFATEPLGDRRDTISGLLFITVPSYQATVLTSFILKHCHVYFFKDELALTS